MKGALSMPWRLVLFTLWYIGQVLKSASQVSHDIVTPGREATPRVVRMPAQSTTDAQLTAIASLITLTPGTLTIGVVEREGGRDLLVHSMYDPDRDTAVHHLREMEARMLNAVTIKGGYRA
ncbi:sodium:proton antiporter [Aeromicrobium phragmitis]|uniref:Sodium:proton antiporter n=1 Tax=Aeromicrobium phragmitis TaxID=2478914 RepID=A0A3L8PN88_9ACTN|nr:Na+/H+ antiporter subunit E [Aeromicrobium phragmitis]RLV56259.1 sodium:proton antiporter [Aeromicrobium phragmitis]